MAIYNGLDEKQQAFVKSLKSMVQRETYLQLSVNERKFYEANPNERGVRQLNLFMRIAQKHMKDWLAPDFDEAYQKIEEKSQILLSSPELSVRFIYPWVAHAKDYILNRDERLYTECDYADMSQHHKMKAADVYNRVKNRKEKEKTGQSALEVFWDDTENILLTIMDLEKTGDIDASCKKLPVPLELQALKQKDQKKKDNDKKTNVKEPAVSPASSSSSAATVPSESQRKEAEDQKKSRTTRQQQQGPSPK